MAATVPIATAASIDQRFAQLIQQFGLTKNSFAISLGKTASVVQHLIDGRNKPGFDLMCKVFEVYPNVSRDWLLLGRGPMLIGSNGISGAAVAASKPATPEPDFEPIDLADVAPRTPRRPTGNRLQPEEIAATLALATAAIDSEPNAMAVLQPPVAPVATEPVAPEVAAATPPTVASSAQTSNPELRSPHEAAAAMKRPTRPFRPAAATMPTTSNKVPAATTVVPEVPLPVAPVAPASSLPVSLPSVAPDAYVAAAIHAQHLQHQLALAELRNQHLLEQQQMLREMLAMARQSMV